MSGVHQPGVVHPQRGGGSQPGAVDAANYEISAPASLHGQAAEARPAPAPPGRPGNYATSDTHHEEPGVCSGGTGERTGPAAPSLDRLRRLVSHTALLVHEQQAGSPFDEGYQTAMRHVAAWLDEIEAAS